MQYLIDSNVLITANATYYESGRIPPFWDWLARQAASSVVKMPIELVTEITPSEEDRAFRDWMDSNAANLSLGEEQLEQTVIHVLEQGYGFDPSTFLDDIPLANTNDAMLIAYAFAAKENRCVVTLEAVQHIENTLPNPENRKIPLVCNLLGVSCIDTFDLIRELDFRIPRST